MRAVALICSAMLMPGAVFAAGSSPPHRGGSPWSFTIIAEPSDTFVVNDTDSPSIDQFLFRSQGPISIDVPIRRYVGPTDASGHLLNASDLVARGIVSADASIRLPAFDVDQNTFPVFDCDGDGVDDQLLNEVDVISFNGEKLGKLEGDNNIWTQQSFTVPIEKLKFPSSPGASAINTISVDVDTANADVVLSSGAVGCEVWGVTVDWVGIKFKASSPVVLVHGIRSQGGVWGNFRSGLDAEHVVSDNSITLGAPATPDPAPVGCADSQYNDSIDFDVAQLKNLVPAIAEKYGTSSIHFGTHSKGGLDSLGFISSLIESPIQVTVGTMGGQPVKRDLEARSIVTLDTPHQGSVLAKYGVEARQLTTLQAVRAGVNVVAAKELEGSYYCDLTPARASAFTASHPLPSDTQGGSVASDADQNGNQRIDTSAEATGFGLARIADRLYQLMGRVADVTITVTPRPFLPDRITVAEVPTATFQPNDAIVTTASAAHYPLYPITGFNHLDVHATQNATTIARDAQGPGVVDWRER
jgi:hypothetical protein